MSKAAQRKQSAYSEGRKDGVSGKQFRWLRHPQLDSYRAGYTAGRTARMSRMERIRERGQIRKRERIPERAPLTPADFFGAAHGPNSVATPDVIQNLLNRALRK